MNHPRDCQCDGDDLAPCPTLCKLDHVHLVKCPGAPDETWVSEFRRTDWFSASHGDFEPDRIIAFFRREMIACRQNFADIVRRQRMQYYELGLKHGAERERATRKH